MNLDWQNIEFVSPWFFLLLILLPMVIIWKQRKKLLYNNPVTISSLSPIKGISNWKEKLLIIQPILKSLAFIAFITALARPQLALKEEVVNAEGIDIFMVMDLSSSMLAKDFEPDRLEVSKEVAIDFVEKRPYDRIGLAVFAGESFTQCPLTTDHRILKNFLADLECGLLEDGTAIGMGLASAVNRLKDTETKSKIIILLTDGVNNVGYIKPKTAAEIAQEFDIKVYTIGIGSRGEALTPVSRRSDGQYVFGYARVEIDEELLNEIAKMTGGQYFRATDVESLVKIYAEIDELEKTKMEITTFKRYEEQYRYFLWTGLLFLLVDFVLSNTLLRIIP